MFKNPREFFRKLVSCGASLIAVSFDGVLTPCDAIDLARFETHALPAGPENEVPDPKQ